MLAQMQVRYPARRYMSTYVDRLMLQQATRAANSAAAAAAAPTRGTSPTRHKPVPADSHLSPIVR